MIDELTGETWRFWVGNTDATNAKGTIYRSRLWQLPSDGDQWRWYWEDSEIAGFYDEGYRDGCRVLDTSATEDSARALVAYLAEKRGDRGAQGGLDRLAVRLTENAEARFICVGLDRGTDLYVLSWSGDPDGVWRDEIEAVWNGDIWRLEVERYEPRYGEYGEEACWVPEDDCPEWYGEDVARAAWEKSYPLAEFPAECSTKG